MLRLLRLALIVAGGPAFVLPATAQHGPQVVVELFTAQGCVACPPAEAFLADLADRPDVIALALHVDYWDYIGWRDTFAQARFSERQKAYARGVGARTIYTPQMVVQGSEPMPGTRAEDVTARIAAAAAEAPRVLADVVGTDGQMLLILNPAADPVGRAVVQIVEYLPHADVVVEAGENAGQTLANRNVVTSWETLGEWDGATRAEFALDHMGDSPAVVIVQLAGPGPILAALRLP